MRGRTVLRCRSRAVCISVEPICARCQPPSAPRRLWPAAPRRPGPVTDGPDGAAGICAAVLASAHKHWLLARLGTHSFAHTSAWIRIKMRPIFATPCSMGVVIVAGRCASARELLWQPSLGTALRGGSPFRAASAACARQWQRDSDKPNRMRCHGSLRHVYRCGRETYRRRISYTYTEYTLLPHLLISFVWRPCRICILTLSDRSDCQGDLPSRFSFFTLSAPARTLNRYPSYIIAALRYHVENVFAVIQASPF